MADILIRGMEMPKGCKSCKLSSDSHCNATGQWLFSTDLLRSGFNWKTCRLENCPLIELPPHGDLIDRDGLPKERVEWEDIDSAPVIVPAEREETT